MVFNDHGSVNRTEYHTVFYKMLTRYDILMDNQNNMRHGIIYLSTQVPVFWMNLLPQLWGTRAPWWLKQQDYPKSQ